MKVLGEELWIHDLAVAIPFVPRIPRAWPLVHFVAFSLPPIDRSEDIWSDASILTWCSSCDMYFNHGRSTTWFVQSICSQTILSDSISSLIISVMTADQANTQQHRIWLDTAHCTWQSSGGTAVCVIRVSFNWLLCKKHYIEDPSATYYPIKHGDWNSLLQPVDLIKEWELKDVSAGEFSVNTVRAQKQRRIQWLCMRDIKWKDDTNRLVEDIDHLSRKQIWAENASLQLQGVTNQIARPLLWIVHTFTESFRLGLEINYQLSRHANVLHAQA